MKQSLITITCFLTILSHSISTNAGNIIYNEKDLSSSLTTAITQDSQGYIWIGTEYGLNRFDGISFKTWHKDEENEGSIKSNIIRSLFNDSEGRLWVGYLNGLQLYNPDTDTFSDISFGETQRALNISNIYELSNGKIWVEASRMGIFEVDKDNLTASRVKEIRDLCGTDNIIYLYEDNNGRIWVSTYDKGLICINSKLTKVTGSYFVNQPVMYGGKISQNKDNILIVSFGNDLYMFDEVRKEFVAIPPPMNKTLIINNFLQRSNGDFIISTHGQGLWRINEDRRSIEKHNISFNDDTDIEKSRIVSMMEDRDGNLWIGSFQQGIMMLPYEDENSFHQWEVGTPSCIYRSPDGYIWCGTQDGYLFKLDNDGNILFRQREASEIMCITKDSNGDLWMGVRNLGVLRINPDNGSRTSIDMLKGKNVTDIVENGNRTLFLSVSGEGIWKYSLRTGQCSKLTSSNTGSMQLLTNTYINKMFNDSKERLWIGHYLGISCYDTQAERFINIEPDTLLKTSVCYALTETRDGKILIGTNNGLYQWDGSDGKYTRYTTNDGLSSDMICGVGEDLDGNIWCSTFRGINSIGKNNKNIVSWYGYNGASKREYIRNCYHSDGRNIYFGNLSGITKFETPVKTQSKTTEIRLTGFHIGTQEIPAGSIEGKIRLNHNENTFTLGLSPMTFTEDAIRINYRLMGLNPEWNSTRYGINQVTYNDIKPGKYIFEAYSEENGIKSETYSLEITISKPWYSSIAAYILYMVLGSCMIAFIYFDLKRRGKERSNYQKLDHYINLAHEIRTPMVMISNPLENLIADTRNPETLNTMLTMKRNADRITRTLDQLLEVKKLDAGNISMHRKTEDLVKVINDSLSYFSYQARKKKISLIFDHAVERLDISIDANHIDTILYNLINNSFKYTPEGGEIVVSLNISPDDGNAIICVKDTGTGLIEKNIKNIFKRFYQDPSRSTEVKGFGIGLNLCEMLIKLHGGTITASNRKERSGAEFTISIPIVAADVDTQKEDTAEYLIKENIQKESNNENEVVKKIKPTKSEKILIVDDDDEIRLYLEEQLSRTYKIITAENGDTGIQKALTEVPDLIISDIRMPGADGYALLKKIKGNPNTTHIPVIILTGKNELDDKIIGLEHGADSYMAKPFHMTELRIMVDNLLKNRQRIRGKYSGAYQEDKIKEIELESDNDILMKRIMKVINDNLDNTDLKVEMLSMEIGLSRVQLHRRMKEMTGISTGEFIRNIRLKKAAELLSEKKVNVSQVAYMVGFGSLTHFSTAFRKFYGVSPTEYMNRS